MPSALLELAGDTELPAQAEAVWAAFRELSAGRGSNGWGPNPLTWTDLEAWQRLTGARLAAGELGWILSLDHVWLHAVSEAAKEGKA